jgi:two-component system C4-dicarboxylate transport response regulator DctD
VIVLIVEDDRAVREALGQTLELADLEVVLASSFVAAKDIITPGFTGIIVSDIRMPGRDGLYLLEYAHGIDPDLPVILLTGEGDIPMAVAAMARGAFDFLEKPCPADRIVATVNRAIQSRGAVLKNRRVVVELAKGDPAARMLFGDSDKAEALRTQARQIARIDGPVLIEGPPGSGVSKVAEVVHLLSTRNVGPF